MEDKEQKNKKTKKIIILILLLIMLIIIIIACGIAYSKYITRGEGTATVETATMICEMEVESSEETPTVINPYCTITVSNYNEDQVTETNVGFTIDVSPKGDFVLPEFEWRNSSGQVIARSVDVVDQNGNVTARTANFPRQTFAHSQAEDKVYTIVFKNTGEEEITRRIDFNLHAIQVQN